jgi:peptide/nickel transport system substrate-binding protein
VYSGFASALDFPILPKHILENVDPATLLESSFSTNPVSSGPFSYNAQQAVGTNGESIIYLTNNEHFYKGAPKIKSFVVHAYNSIDDIKTAIKTGAVSATAELLPTDSNEVASNAIYEKQTAINSGVFLFFNTKSGVFKNRSIRKAVQSGLDIDEVRTLIGDEKPLNYPVLQSQLELTEWPSLPTRDFEAAQQTISESEEKQIRLVTVNSGYFPTILEDVAEQLEAMGFEVARDIEEPGQDFIVNIIANRNYDILLYEVELGANPDLLVYYHSSQATQTGLNLSNYNSSVADDLILSARETADPNIQKQKYESFIIRWIEDAPAIGLYQVNMSYYFDKNVKTFSEDTSLVVPTDRFVDVKFWGVEKVFKNRTP